MSETVIPEWLGVLQQQHRLDPERRTLFKVVPDDSAAVGHRLTLGFHTKNEVPAPAIVSFEAVPNKASVTVEVLDTAPWRFENLKADATLTILRTDSSKETRTRTSFALQDGPTVGAMRSQAPELIAIRLADSVAGTVRLEGPDGGPALLTTEPECSASLAFVNGSHSCIQLGTTVRASVEGGYLEGNFNELVVKGDVYLGGRGKTAPTTQVERLEVPRSVVVTVSDGAARLRVDLAVGDGPDAGLTFELAGDHTEESRPPVDIRTVKGLRLQAPALRPLTVRQLDHATVGGATNLKVGKSADKVTFEPNGSSDSTDAVHLSASSRAVLSNLSGELVLVDIAGAHLDTAARSELLVRDIQPGPDATPLKGAYMRGFSLPHGLEGRTLLSYFDDAHVVEPSARSLPGSQYALIGKAIPFTKSSNTHRARRETEHDAEFMRKLHELTKTKGASGGVRTWVGWCAQRLRHRTAPTPVEWVTLWAYRLLGYGERAIPALLTWLALALLFASIQLNHSHGGLHVPHHIPTGALIKAWGHQLAGPLSGVLGGGQQSLNSQWGYIGRAILAVPLVTGLLSLRHYVRVAG